MKFIVPFLMTAGMLIGCAQKAQVADADNSLSPAQTERVEAIIEEIEPLENSSLVVQFDSEAGS